MNRRQLYRQSRDLGHPRRTSLRHALIPTRVELAWNVLNGRPVMYRVAIDLRTGQIKAASGSMFANCEVSR